jgi:tetratricopeptide repeat protein
VAPGPLSSIRGRALLTLGRVFQAQGKGEEVRAALQTALENLQNTLGADHKDTISARELLAKLGSQPQ